MKQINIKVYPNGMTSCNPLVMNFDRENNTTEIIVDYSEVDYLDWTKQLDLVFADGTHTYIEGTSNTLTVPLLEEYLKQGIISLQPLAKRLVVDEYEKVKWQIANVTVRESLNVLENDTSITPSIAEQWEIRIQAVEDAEVIRQENENIRISSETLRIENEIARNTFVNYSNSTQYQAGNKVAYQGSSYVAKSDTIGHLPTDTNYWLLIAQKGEQGEQGIQGIQGIQGEQGIQGLKGNQWKGAYSGSTSYVVDDVVSYNGSSYICILASLNNLPTNTTYFSLFAQKGDNTSASVVTNTPSGNISATTVQGAINELDTEKADKLFATNLVTNGDFSNGTTGWSPHKSILSIDNGRLKITANDTVGYGQAYQIYTTTIGHAYYWRFKGEIGTVVPVLLTPSGVSFQTSGVYVATATTTLLKISFGGLLNDYAFADNVLCLNLTQIFGAGKEPTKEQVDWLLAQKYANSWFDGTKELTSITDLLTLVNTKADKTQEAWITPTLQSGWLEYGAGFETVRYMKDQFGFVHLKGLLKSGTVGVVCMTLPAGYRPSVTQHIATASNNAFGFVTINNLGVVAIMSGSNVWFSLNNITFKAEA